MASNAPVESRMARKPQLSFWQIWNMCFGFLGIQFGFALQNANVSRIFQTLGAEVDDIAGLWIAAPLTGLVVQPIVGYFSDRTWNWLGRRRPYFLAGALLASLALFLMPRSPTLWIAAGMLWMLDASINIAMEPFRAFVADQMPPRQRPAGYSMQSFFIGVGSVVASMLPWFLDKAGVSNVGDGANAVPDTVRYSFEFGAVVLLGAILWTILTTREYPPAELHAFAASQNGLGVEVLRLPIPEENAAKHPFAEIGTQTPSLNPFLVTVLLPVRKNDTPATAQISRVNEQELVIKLNSSVRGLSCRVFDTEVIPEFEIVA